jgi:hypothetical protein
MSGQVTLYFDDQADALRFALAAGSVMSGEKPPAATNLAATTACISRIQLDADAPKSKPESPTEQ